MTITETAAVDTARLQAFMGKMVGDMSTAISGALVLIGDKLGLYKALAEGGPASSDELAERTGVAERYVREWLAAQAASGYVEYDAATRRFSMTPEQAMALANETSPVYVAGAFELIARPTSTSQRSRQRSGPATASPGTSTTNACSAASSASSAAAIPPSSSRPGSRPSKG